MSADNASSAEMRRPPDPDADPLAIDDDTVEQLLSGTLPPAGTPPAYAKVAELLAAAAAAPSPEELAGQGAVLAELRAVARARWPPPRLRPRPARRRRRGPSGGGRGGGRVATAGWPERPRSPPRPVRRRPGPSSAPRRRGAADVHPGGPAPRRSSDRRSVAAWLDRTAPAGGHGAVQVPAVPGRPPPRTWRGSARPSCPGTGPGRARSWTRPPSRPWPARPGARARSRPTARPCRQGTRSPRRPKSPSSRSPPTTAARARAARRRAPAAAKVRATKARAARRPSARHRPNRGRRDGPARDELSLIVVYREPCHWLIPPNDTRRSRSPGGSDAAIRGAIRFCSPCDGPAVRGVVAGLAGAPKPPGNNGTADRRHPLRHLHNKSPSRLQLPGRNLRYDEGDHDATAPRAHPPPNGPATTRCVADPFIGEDANSGGGSEGGLDASETTPWTSTHRAHGADSLKMTSTPRDPGSGVKHKVFWGRLRPRSDHHHGHDPTWPPRDRAPHDRAEQDGRPDDHRRDDHHRSPAPRSPHDDVATTPPPRDDHQPSRTRHEALDTVAPLPAGAALSVANAAPSDARHRPGACQ